MDKKNPKCHGMYCKAGREELDNLLDGGCHMSRMIDLDIHDRLYIEHNEIRPIHKENEFAHQPYTLMTLVDGEWVIGETKRSKEEIIATGFQSKEEMIDFMADLGAPRESTTLVPTDGLKDMQKEIAWLKAELVLAHSKLVTMEKNFMMDCPVDIPDCECEICKESRR